MNGKGVLHIWINFPSAPLRLLKYVFFYLSSASHIFFPENEVCQNASYIFKIMSCNIQTSALMKLRFEESRRFSMCIETSMFKLKYPKKMFIDFFHASPQMLLQRYLRWAAFPEHSSQLSIKCLSSMFNPSCELYDVTETEIDEDI